MDRQPDLFDPPPTMAQAVAARDAALELVESNAGKVWIEAATGWLRGFLEGHAEYVPDRDNQGGPQPAERRAWGTITRRALRNGWLELTGYAPRTRGHATPGPVYKSLIFGGQS